MIVTSLRKTFDWSGKATRREAWLFLLFVFLCVTLAFALEVWLTGGPAFVPHFGYVAAGILLPPQVALWIRRAHDAGRSARWLLLGIVPFLGILLGLYLLFAPGKARRGYSEASGLALIAGVALTACATLLLISRVFWVPCWFPSTSMEPTLLAGDYLAVWLPIRYAPEAGDLLVYRNVATNADLVTRLMGRPGDTVQMKDGVLWLNGIAVPQADAGRFEEVFAPQGPAEALPHCSNEPVGIGGTCVSARLSETLPNGRRYDILNIGTTATDTTAVFTVPPGQYFVMGDNRDNSNDSRIAAAAGGAGMVPADHVVGRADKVVFSAAGRSFAYFWDWRPGRFLVALQ